mgnify:CR=1 FL=1
MPTRLRKTRKMRGKRWHGYGSKKKHRGGGSRGGRGYGGSHKHKFSYIVKYEPEHYGKRGFVSLNKTENKVINLDDLEKIFRKTGKKEFDLAEMGYDKLLSRGKISQPLIVKAKKYSQAAKEKIEAAGGKMVEE